MLTQKPQRELDYIIPAMLLIYTESNLMIGLLSDQERRHLSGSQE